MSNKTIVKTLTEIKNDSDPTFWWKKLDLGDLPATWKVACYMSEQDENMLKLNPKNDEDFAEYERLAVNIQESLPRFVTALKEHLGDNVMNSKWVYSPYTRLYTLQSEN